MHLRLHSVHNQANFQGQWGPTQSSNGFISRPIMHPARTRQIPAFAQILPPGVSTWLAQIFPNLAWGGARKPCLNLAHFLPRGLPKWLPARCPFLARALHTEEDPPHKLSEGGRNPDESISSHCSPVPNKATCRNVVVSENRTWYFNSVVGPSPGFFYFCLGTLSQSA